MIGRGRWVRVGFPFALTSTLVWLVNPTASLDVAVTLMGVALLESVFNVCVGCLVYSEIVFDLAQRPG